MNLASYYVCRFSGTWSVYDTGSLSTKTLHPSQGEIIRMLFAAVINENAVLDAFALTIVSGRKLPRTLKAEYFLFRIEQVWVLQESSKKFATVVLTKDIPVLEDLFPGICTDLINDTAMISPISANKLQSVTSSKVSQQKQK